MAYMEIKYPALRDNSCYIISVELQNNRVVRSAAVRTVILGQLKHMTKLGSKKKTKTQMSKWNSKVNIKKELT